MFRVLSRLSNSRGWSSKIWKLLRTRQEVEKTKLVWKFGTCAFNLIYSKDYSLYTFSARNLSHTFPASPLGPPISLTPLRVVLLLFLSPSSSPRLPKLLPHLPYCSPAFHSPHCSPYFLTSSPPGGSLVPMRHYIFCALHSEMRIVSDRLHEAAFHGEMYLMLHL